MSQGTLSISVSLVSETALGDHAKYRSLIVIGDAETDLSALFRRLSPKLEERAAAFQKKIAFQKKAGKSFTFETESGPRVHVALLPKKGSAFALLSWARTQGKSIARGEKQKTLVIFAKMAPEITTRALEAWLFAATVNSFQLPRIKKKHKSKPVNPVDIFVDATKKEKVEAILLEASALARANNLVRELAVLPSNVLNPTEYRKIAEREAKAHGLKTEWIALKELQKIGAGAFEAVAKGSHDPNSGILKVSYVPKSSKGHFALVGKGLCYDTGGFNLKTGHYMFGMNEDMTGSAVVLALCLALKQIQFPMGVTGYLALTENILAPNAYRPNDVVTSLSGKTIEVVDTDAEGRMVLADTLTLAAQSGPRAIVDFATLTGSCVRAIGTNYSGAYSNRKALYPLIRKSGVQSGERVWPFPNDADYGKCLKSELADIKQCRLTGGSDHIEAGYFLSQFVPKNVPWVHVDLSACENEGGLGAVATKTTGFGVRFGVQLLKNLLQRGVNG